jgi:uncharacterized protein (DUF58 family)
MARLETPHLFAADTGHLRALHGRMQGLAQQFRLPFRRSAWRGNTGNWLGVGAGSSIDFQDHRPYLPGDDPRYIDWQAYARSGQYIMKLYREEVSPRIDVIVDVSASMALTPAKHTRALELAYFALESALRTQAAVRTFLVSGESWRMVPVEPWLAHRLDDGNLPEPSADPPVLDPLPLRHGSLRIWISDLLFPAPPDDVLQILRRARGQAVCYVPYCGEESDPEWAGNVEFHDCEAGAVRRQRVEGDLHRSYVDAYHRHFEIWREQAQRRDIPLARFPAAGSLSASMQDEGLRCGAVETWLG